MTIYFKTTIYSYGFVAGLAQILGLQDYRPLIVPCGMILVVYSLVVYPNVVYMMDFDSTVWIPYVLTMGLILPILILGAGMVHKKMKKKTIIILPRKTALFGEYYCIQ